jgi:hypothetical protein
MTEHGKTVAILDPEWPYRPLQERPGDLSRMLPQGLGLGVPLIVTPYTSAPSGGFYGLDASAHDPFHAAPTQEPCGGLLYFDDAVDLQRLHNALAVIGVHGPRTDYTVFAAQANDPVAERYLDQVRIISKAALGHFFGLGAEAGALPDQQVPLGDYVERFIAEQKAKWNDPKYTFSRRLDGTLGGDGDWAKESLAFGFYVENTSWGVYRLWSRPWLVTK